MIANSSILWGGVLLLVIAVLWTMYDSDRLRRLMHQSRKKRERLEEKQRLLQKEWSEFLLSENYELEQLRMAMHPKYALILQTDIVRKTGIYPI